MESGSRQPRANATSNDESDSYGVVALRVGTIGVLAVLTLGDFGKRRQALASPAVDAAR